MPTRRSFGLFCSLLLFVPLVALGPRPAGAVPTEPGGLTNPLLESLDCQNCHSFPNAMGHEADPPYAPFFGWQGTLMANAARDPVFWAGVALADQDEPGGTEDCVRCHAPRAFIEGRGDAISMDALSSEDLEGVGFNPRLVPDPTLDPWKHIEDRKKSGKRIGGYGLHLVKNIMDEIMFNRKGNVVIMTKYFDPVKE